jgi:NADH dehydrogenase
MSRNIVIIGSGFAGTMAALGASRLRHEKGVSPEELTITVVSPTPEMVIRPRLYERNPEQMVAPLSELFAATDIRYHQGSVETIDNATSTITVARGNGTSATLPYDRLVLAAGSDGFAPPIPGLAEFALPPPARRSGGVGSPSPCSCAKTRIGGAQHGGGRRRRLHRAGGRHRDAGRLREILGEDADIRVIIVDRSEHVAPAMGADPRPFIEERLRALGIETRMNVGIAALDEKGVTLGSGERIETMTVIWSAGMRASPLTAQLPAERDNLGRLIVEPDLRVPGGSRIFATGDTAKARTDSVGNYAAMSCQHARRLGSFAGHNAAADLLGEPTLPYDQPIYVTCLDLGPDNAIFTRGWDSKVEITGAQAKAVKKEINEVWIYPPAAERTAAYENVLYARTADF